MSVFEVAAESSIFECEDGGPESRSMFHFPLFRIYNLPFSPRTHRSFANLILTRFLRMFFRQTIVVFDSLRRAVMDTPENTRSFFRWMSLMIPRMTSKNVAENRFLQAATSIES